MGYIMTTQTEPQPTGSGSVDNEKLLLKLRHRDYDKRPIFRELS